MNEVNDARHNDALLGLAMAVSETVESAAVGIVVVDRELALVSANERARAFLDRGDGIHLRGERRLRARRPGESRELERLVGRVIDAAGGERLTGSIAIGKLTGARPYTLIVRSYVSPEDSTQPPLAIIAVHDPDHRSRVSRPALADLFKLTDAESNVLAVLVETGWTGPAIALALEISPHTVKSHIEAVRHKVGADNQLDLMRRVVATPGVFEQG